MRYIVKVRESLVATYLIEKNEEIECKNDLMSGEFEIIDTLDDGNGNIIQEEVISYKESNEN